MSVDAAIPLTRTPGRRCRKCDEPMSGARNTPEGHVRHVGRGLCSFCYNVVYRAGQIDLYPKLQNDRAALIAIYADARATDPGISQRAVADELGVPRSTLAMALHDQRKATADGTH